MLLCKKKYSNVGNFSSFHFVRDFNVIHEKMDEISKILRYLNENVSLKLQKQWTETERKHILL